MLGAAANAVVRTLLGPVCAACRGPLDRPLAHAVCAACWGAIPRLTPPLCERCGVALAGGRLCAACEVAAPAYDAARSVGFYAGAFRLIIHAFKYDGRRTLAVPLAALLRDAAADLIASADVAVPVPQHPWRALGRGFNQADDLAQHLGLPVCRPLRRVRHGPPQARLGGRARRESVRHAFGRRRFALLAAAPWARHLSQCRVALIDDVMTTGATVDDCTRVLLDAGARSVVVLTLARVPAPPPASPRLEPRPSTLPHR